MNEKICLPERRRIGAFDRFKVLILVAFCCRLAVAAFLVPPLQNDREGTPKQLIHSVANGLTHFNLFRKM